VTPSFFILSSPPFILPFNAIYYKSFKGIQQKTTNKKCKNLQSIKYVLFFFQKLIEVDWAMVTVDYTQT
jgi:hypothetical protein